jgi:hypothetical protein
MLALNKNNDPMIVILSWLGLSNLFQTFEDLDSVKDKEADIVSIREVLHQDDEDKEDGKGPLC